MSELFLGVLLQGLKLWSTEAGQKYHDRVIDLRTEWRKEYKPRNIRNNKRLDEIEAEIKDISKTFAELGPIK